MHENLSVLYHIMDYLCTDIKNKRNKYLKILLFLDKLCKTWRLGKQSEIITLKKDGKYLEYISDMDQEYCEFYLTGTWNIVDIEKQHIEIKKVELIQIINGEDIVEDYSGEPDSVTPLTVEFVENDLKLKYSLDNGGAYVYDYKLCEHKQPIFTDIT